MPHTLYSFRRCPYAMRARLALCISQQQVNLREIILKEKPPEMIAISSKGTVPVLELSDGCVLDESLDIMAWALEQSDPQGWLKANLTDMLNLIDRNDFEFKFWLDRYKYADRFPEKPESYYREQAEEFLIELENRLQQQTFLFAEHLTLADAAIFPFIRQFSSVDKGWFTQSSYPYLQKWLSYLTNSQLFTSIMHKYPAWLETKGSVKFPVEKS